MNNKSVEKLDGKQLSTSMVSKAKWALAIPNRYRGGGKKCSVDYWVRIVHYLGKLYNVPQSRISDAKKNTSLYHRRSF
jgi:hypothetical protein